MLYNFSEEFKSPQKIQSAMKELELTAKNISMELPSLLYVSNSSYTVSASFIYLLLTLGNENVFSISLGSFAIKWAGYCR